jgi:hypothetical protein
MKFSARVGEYFYFDSYSKSETGELNYKRRFKIYISETGDLIIEELINDTQKMFNSENTFRG